MNLDMELLGNDFILIYRISSIPITYLAIVEFNENRIIKSLEHLPHSLAYTSQVIWYFFSAYYTKIILVFLN